MHATNLTPGPLDWRQPGCTPYCRRLKAIEVGTRQAIFVDVHDWEGHERYGRLTPSGQLSGTQVIGLLEVDHNANEVRIGGEPVGLTVIEWRLVQSLARWAGEIVPHSDLLRMVWGNTYHDAYHMLRTNMARMRVKLGPAAGQIQTRKGLGYGLFEAADPRAVHIRPITAEPMPRSTAVRPYVMGSRQLQVLFYLRDRRGRRVTLHTAAQATYGQSTANTRNNLRGTIQSLQWAGVPVDIEDYNHGQEHIKLTAPLPKNIRAIMATKGR